MSATRFCSVDPEQTQSEVYFPAGLPQVLQSLQYVDGSGAVQLKGRVACQISSHELLLTELLFENALSPLAPEESAALLSCLVFTQNTQVEPHITNTLQEVRRKGFHSVLAGSFMLVSHERQHCADTLHVLAHIYSHITIRCTRKTHVLQKEQQGRFTTVTRSLIHSSMRSVPLKYTFAVSVCVVNCP